MSIVTDSAPVEAPKDPETNIIFQLYRLFASPEEQEIFAEQFRAGGLGYGQAKQHSLKSECLSVALSRTTKRNRIKQRKVEQILQKEEKKARFLAKKNAKSKTKSRAFVI